MSSNKATKKVIKADRFLQEMEQVIPWKEILNLIQPHYYSNQTGRQATPLLTMLKIYTLQQWYQLSDPGMEEAIYDRFSFQKFLKIDLVLDNVPDETTILHFRHLLEKHDLTNKIFNQINEYLAKKGHIMKQGTIVDATLIAASSSTKNKEKKRDAEMSSSKKNNQWHFGMKMHIGVDSRTGAVHSAEFTTGKVSDREKFFDLLNGEEIAIFGDKGYVCKKDKHLARDAGIYWGVLDKREQHQQLSSSQKKRNWKLSKIRAKVEHPFQVIKHLWGYRRTRYKGIYKNRCQQLMLLTLSNLYRLRKKLALC